jgi:hypothetical protein
MSHLDEGTLHALLDGELEMTEVREIQAHLGTCSACGSRLRQVKEFYAEADRLVGRIDVPGSAAGASATRARGPVAPAGRGERIEPPLPPAEPPILLLPDNPTWADRRRRLVAPLKWVAVLAVAVGAGFLVSEARRGSQAAKLASAPAAESTPTPVLSAEEATPAPDSATLPATARGDLAVAESAPPAPPRQARPTAPPPAPVAAAKAKPEQVAQAKDTAPDQVVDSADEANDRLVELAERKAETPPSRPASADAPPPPSNVRTEAARAMEELDRERQVARAAAATAALDSARRREQALRQQRAAVTPTAAPAAPPQRTLEQRAETYLRIGLDEAARQLGRPVHVIEGMSPLFIGLAQGRTSPGADSTRPVVRVVYQDGQGRLILLDQQRLRPGQSTVAPASPEPHWTMGEILLHLHGEIGPEVLRTLRSRVR